MGNFMRNGIHDMETDTHSTESKASRWVDPRLSIDGAPTAASPEGVKQPSQSNTRTGLVQATRSEGDIGVDVLRGVVHEGSDQGSKSQGSPWARRQPTARDVTVLLLKMGMPVGLRGFAYLRNAVLLQLQANKNRLSMTKDVYPTIAEEFDTTPGRVERSIRHAIRVTWERGNPQVWNELFRYVPRGKSGFPTNGEMMATLSEWLLLFMEDERV